MLLSAAGVGVMEIVRTLGKSKVTVGRWQERYMAQGICGLPRDATRPGRKPPLSAETIERVVQKTLHEKPVGATHWSIRKMARAAKDAIDTQRVGINVRKAIAAEAREQLLREQAANLDKVVKSGGLSEDAAASMRRQILGLAT